MHFCHKGGDRVVGGKVAEIEERLDVKVKNKPRASIVPDQTLALSAGTSNLLHKVEESLDSSVDTNTTDSIVANKSPPKVQQASICC